MFDESLSKFVEFWLIKSLRWGEEIEAWPSTANNRTNVLAERLLAWRDAGTAFPRPRLALVFRLKQFLFNEKLPVS